MKIENVQVENVTDECIIWLQNWLGKGGDVKVGFSIFIIPEIWCQNIDTHTEQNKRVKCWIMLVWCWLYLPWEFDQASIKLYQGRRCNKWKKHMHAKPFPGFQENFQYSIFYSMIVSVNIFCSCILYCQVSKFKTVTY